MSRSVNGGAAVVCRSCQTLGVPRETLRLSSAVLNSLAPSKLCTLRRQRLCKLVGSCVETRPAGCPSRLLAVSELSAQLEPRGAGKCSEFVPKLQHGLEAEHQCQGGSVLPRTAAHRDTKNTEVAGPEIPERISTRGPVPFGCQSSTLRHEYESVAVLEAEAVQRYEYEGVSVRQAQAAQWYA